MKKLFALLIFILFICGCTNIARGLKAFGGGADYVEIEDAYKAGDITKAEYLNLKIQNHHNQIENNHTERVIYR
jgi:uncharacterized protein YxeA